MNELHYINLEYYFNQIVEFFRSLGNPDIGAGRFILDLGNFFHVFFLVLLPAGIVILMVLWIYYHIRVIELRREEKDVLHEKLQKKREEATARPENQRWNRITELFTSVNQGDWRLAIIEADSMLEELIVQLGYTGDNLGERLKNIPQGDFPLIQEAWDVHLVRNKIAHEGLDFDLTERQKRHVHSSYKQIFERTNFI